MMTSPLVFMQVAWKLEEACAKLPPQLPLNSSLLPLNVLSVHSFIIGIHEVTFMNNNFILVDATMDSVQIGIAGPIV